MNSVQAMAERIEEKTEFAKLERAQEMAAYEAELKSEIEVDKRRAAKLKTEWKSVRKKWTAKEIREKLMTDDSWLIRGLMAIYKKQEVTEQDYEETHFHNKVGFTGYDAPFLTKIAKFFERYKRLSPKQIKSIRYRRSGKPKMACYSGQLAKIANGEI